MPNPEGPAVIVDNTPIWQRSNAEKLPGSTPMYSRYIIWKYNPTDEGVRKFPSYGKYDPAPHHYYRTPKEYEDAVKIFNNGGYSEPWIEVTTYGFSNGENKVHTPELTVYESTVSNSAPIAIDDAAA